MTKTISAPGNEKYDFKFKILHPHDTDHSMFLDPSDCPKKLQTPIDDAIRRWHKIAGATWYKLAPPKARSRSINLVCVDSKLASCSTEYPEKDEPGTVACIDCRENRRTCFRWDGPGSFVLLPVENRLHFDAKGVNVLDNWIV